MAGRVRDTSRLAYRDLIESGDEARYHRQVYEILKERGPLTANEILHVIKETENLKEISHYNIHTRLWQMKGVGAVKEAGKTRDPVSGRLVYKWEVDGPLPDKMPSRKKGGKSQQHKDIIKSLHKHLGWPVAEMKRSKFLSMKDPRIKNWIESSEKILARLKELDL